MIQHMTVPARLFTGPRGRHPLAVWPVLVAAASLAACSATAPFSAAPKVPANAPAYPQTEPAGSDRPVAVPADAPPPPPPTEAGARRHRQYFDQKRKRYYYFDPVLKKYFWEDGTPK